MKLIEINRFIENLSWHKPKNAQKEAIENLMKIENEYVHMLLQNSKKECWENAILVLKSIGYPRNMQAIPQLIGLMQDMNWPGVPIAIDTMKMIDNSILLPYIEHALEEAYKEEDYMWIGGIKRILKDLQIDKEDFINKDTFKLLEYADW